ncbi:DUF4811 domain-containing protein [Lactiplantibacillus sp. WILCCON 0030]|uniref:DUF4811 domain-containing protein n=1 Tax=Lactiplantibacillus brownii TaxID=3069269 RepID=A0ABU1A7K8_9LACO|nr:DUF4811 domain-containing protein [Lactiplantibacillus brownii]MDQ7936923.1 DUF4811 domain-containing protein [Lactiplantibacillus brownii]
MILIILSLGLIGFIVGYLAFKKGWQRHVVGDLGLILLVGAAILMIGNDTQHWGMRQTTTTQRTTLKSAVSNQYVNLLLFEPVKQSNTEKIYVYRTTTTNKRQHTAINLKTTNHVKTANVKSATLITKTTRWTYETHFWRWLYEDTGVHTTLIKRQNTFVLPKTWATLSVSQAKWLEKQAKTAETQASVAVKAAVTAKVQAARTADPTLSTKQLAALTKKVEQAATAAAKQQEPVRLAQLIKAAQSRSIH